MATEVRNLLLLSLRGATQAVLDQQESFKLCDKEAKLKFPGILPGNDCVGSSSASPPRQEANKKQARQDHGEQPSGTKAKLLQDVETQARAPASRASGAQ